MKHLFATAALALVAFFGLTQDSQAGGGLFRRCGGGCDSGCAPACETVVAAPVAPVFEDRKVTRYKQVWTDKVVDALECKKVTRDEKYTYTVCVPVITEEKRKVTVCTPVTREVDYVYTVMVPKTFQKKVQCTSYVCEKTLVVEKVPVCKIVCVTCVDECGRCHVRRERVTVIEEVTRCVITRKPVVTEQVVNYTVCEPVQQKGKKLVCEIVRTEQDQVVKVCSMVNQNREGVRTVCEYVTEKVKRTVKVCETVAYEETIRVQVNACAPACDDCAPVSHGHRFFRRGH